MPTATRSGMTQDAINELIAKRVEEALKAYDSARNPETKIEMENEQQDDNVNANGDNGNGNGNGNGNPNANNGGTKEVVGLTRWFEIMKTVFHISNCLPRYPVKYATCTLLDGALTWWNSHKRKVGVDDAYAMMWKALMKLMTKIYCPRNEIQKIETKLWNLTVKSNDLTTYNQSIQGNAIAAEPVRLQDAIRIANNLMDQKLKGYAIKNAEKREGSTITQETIVDSNKPLRGRMLMARMWQELIQLEIMLKGKHILETCLTATSAEYTTKGHIW
ncbi:reverse transcriptase domain-containing protein [Tanacetum coccineum]